MEANRTRLDAVARHSAINAAPLMCVALISFFAGVLFHALTVHPPAVEAASDRVFELLVYHARPGKTTALESIFHNVSDLQAKHGLNVIGYWVPNGNDPAWSNTFVYLVVHSSRQSAEVNWKALHADPAFLPLRTAAAPLIKKAKGDYEVDEVYMRPTEYSALK